ncbi:hypothetical protein GPJ56_009773 [Histomonas meleagridis]|uniref:uncharacterized protein n=1 Tax=Histomonas meleagridis TaxID=135588 RepID=UPI00355AB758|nr:hypothetical protein GPJ56_009773 [Histomonas meleagridis]KAH0802335.1 hypothetical protein GO595_004948 [Histomonas meleagridis]
MFSLLISFGFALNISDLVFGVWSGREYTTRRVVSQAGTWFQLVPEVHVYSDEFYNESLEMVINENVHSNIVFHDFGHKGNHLMGTEWEHRWYYAQTRHLLTMADLYERFPNKKWYIWADDDTYLYPNSILDFLSAYNSSDFLVFGVIYCTWNNVGDLIKPHRSCHPFAQGGAGVFFSHKMMSSVGPYLRNCSEMFNDPNFAGSMRLAVCIERFVGYEHWNIGDYARNLSPRLHSGNPLLETENGVKEPLSFHRMRHVLLYQIWNATESIWADSDGIDWNIDWDHITMSKFHINIGNNNKPMILHWGFRIRFEHTKDKYFYAVTRPEPVFDSNDRKRLNPKKFRQRFEGNITLQFVCNDDYEKGEMAFESYLFPNEEGTSFYVKCNQPKRFYYTGERNRKPRIIEKPEDMSNYE